MVNVIALKNDKVIGLIIGCIFPYDKYNSLDYKCPKRWEITELIVSKNDLQKNFVYWHSWKIMVEYDTII